MKSFGRKGKEKGELNNPVDVTGLERIIVTECGNHGIQVMSKEGESIFTFGDKGPEKLHHPTCCILYKNIFLVSDGDNHCIKAFDQSGTFLYKFSVVEACTASCTCRVLICSFLTFDDSVDPNEGEN